MYLEGCGIDTIQEEKGKNSQNSPWKISTLCWTFQLPTSPKSAENIWKKIWKMLESVYLSELEDWDQYIHIRLQYMCDIHEIMPLVNLSRPRI